MSTLFRSVTTDPENETATGEGGDRMTWVSGFGNPDGAEERTGQA
jgi:hypothetical protein